MFTGKPFSQMDPRWKDKPLGQDQTTTIGKYGCLLVDLAMIADGFGNDETPLSLNNKLVAAGGFQGAMVIPAILPNVVSGLRYDKYIPCSDQPAPMSEIDSALAEGNPVIVEVDYSPSPGMQNHWVILYNKKGADYLILDPWPYPSDVQEVTLTSRFGFAGSPAQIIQAAIWFRGTAAPQPPKPRPSPKPVPVDGFPVYATADGLALRQGPFVAEDNLIKRVPLNGKLFVLEAPNLARAKIGQVNQWLNVQDTADGYVGYVAAWYVSMSQVEAPQPEPEPTPQPGGESTGTLVYATADGLALRAQPVISDGTLIKRLPLGAQFAVLDPADQAREKIGVNGQWLHVRDVEGDEGYVAAWYVSETKPEAALGVQEKSDQPKPAAETPARLVVRAATDGLALRRQTLISDATLIKREPFNAEMLVLEPVAQAEAKLGMVNQWLHVRDIESDEGYVAAWYVVKRPQPSTP